MSFTVVYEQYYSRDVCLNFDQFLGRVMVESCPAKMLYNISCPSVNLQLILDSSHENPAVVTSPAQYNPLPRHHNPMYLVPYQTNTPVQQSQSCDRISSLSIVTSYLKTKLHGANWSDMTNINSILFQRTKIYSEKKSEIFK